MKDIAVLLQLAVGLWYMQHCVVLQSTVKCCKRIYKYISSLGQSSCKQELTSVKTTPGESMGMHVSECSSSFEVKATPAASVWSV